MKRFKIKTKGKKSYDIILENSFSNFATEMEKLVINNKKICIVTDSNVSPLYEKLIRSAIIGKCLQIESFVFEAGECSKNMETVQLLFAFLIQNKWNRSDMLLALGGGVVGDLTGFCAATYLRGIDFVQVPTSLLSQVDSSIGGKTGVDFLQYKNMVGAFHMPKLVYINVSTLKDLPPREYFSGMAEILKAGLIKDVSFYQWLLQNLYEIQDRDLLVLEEMIFRADKIKAKVVEADPMEQGERALLNFGHTIGHAIEKYMDFQLLHGECVALGCVAAAFISYKKSYLSKEDYYEIRDMFVPFNLPISIESIDIDTVLALTKNDKKMSGNGIRFILLEKVGKAFISDNVSDSEIKESIQELLYRKEA